jgi:hypothetical protein
VAENRSCHPQKRHHGRQLAKAKVNDSYLSRIPRLTSGEYSSSAELLAPDIIEAILAGRQPSTLQLDELLKPLPTAWERQRSELSGSNGNTPIEPDPLNPQMR